MYINKMMLIKVDPLSVYNYFQTYLKVTQISNFRFFDEFQHQTMTNKQDLHSRKV